MIAAFALRATDAMGVEWAARHRVRERVGAWLGWFERHMRGLHGLFVTHSSLASGFDNDVLTAGLPDRSVEGPDTNAFMVIEYRAMAELERRFGGDGSAWEERAATLADQASPDQVAQLRQARETRAKALKADLRAAEKARRARYGAATTAAPARPTDAVTREEGPPRNSRPRSTRCTHRPGRPSAHPW